MNGIRYGRCLNCGDEWNEQDDIVICPECASLQVLDVTKEAEQDAEEER